MSRLIALMICLVMVVAYDPAPVVDPSTAEFEFTPSNYPYDVIFARKMRINETYNGIIDVAELDGEDVTITSSTGELTFQSPTVTIDANAVKLYEYPYTFTPLGLGINDITISVSDGDMVNNKIVLFYTYQNHVPIITGCR